MNLNLIKKICPIPLKKCPVLPVFPVLPFSKNRKNLIEIPPFRDPMKIMRINEWWINRNNRTNKKNK